VDDARKQAWAEHPEEEHDVVIVLRPGSDDVGADTLGVTNIEPIPYQPGMFKARLTGSELLALSQRSEVEGIDNDEEVTALPDDPTRHKPL
jgi:hypothetical protein